MNDANASCIVCGTPFQMRKGKVYCSDSCKTKAYVLRKEGKEVNPDKMRPGGALLVFYIDEYNEWKESENEFTLTLDAYCFFRKNLPNNTPMKEIVKIMSTYYQLDYINDSGVNTSNSVVSQSFKEFQRLFFEGGVKVEVATPGKHDNSSSETVPDHPH